MSNETADSTVYEQLARPFDQTFTDVRGGVALTYITGEQVISRLNEVLGVAGWSFEVREHGIHEQADECWALGRMVARLPRGEVVREQFGTPLDIGFDLKGAATDALKKCAMGLGVGLYLAAKEPQQQRGNGQENGHAANVVPMPQQAGGERLVCELCGEELMETRFRDGTAWTPAQLAGYGHRKHGRTLCMSHYREANDARKRAEAASEDTPF
jgi:hypothetical protein